MTLMTDSVSKRNKVLLVGHCGPDSWMLKSMVGRALPDSEPVMVNSREDLDAALADSRVLLVNRVLDGRFDSESGIELIREIAGRSGPPRTLLISDYEDAQKSAEEAGALPGFGKAETNSDKAVERLQQAYGES